MAPSPQEQAPMDTEVSSINNPNRVVISGMSGLYPDSNHVLDLADILYNKKNPVSAENSRWKYKHPEVTQQTGKIPKLDLFDAQFFKVHYNLCKNMDAMSRKILEQAFQAIYDAGVSPEHLSGRKVGVYIGTCFSETEKACFYVNTARLGFSITGCSRTMFANRISYWLNAKGPSLAIDEACCSSMAAVEQAYLAISRGECEAAIVGGANLCLHPQSSIHYGRIMKLCMDGKTKSFDQNADGCAKSEAINILFLQKAKDALRIYADILYVKSEFTDVQKDETGAPRFGFYRQPSKVVNFLNNFYKEAGIPPQAVEYVEAFGSVLEADKSELEALGEVFCRDRTDPLLVGSIMSNIGYAEAAAGICGINKVLLGYQKGELAGNLHCTKPIDDVKALQEGKMKILTDHTKFNRTYAAVNGMSVTGINAHVLLHGYNKPKDLNRYKSSIPQLVTISGRQESSVRRILTELNTHPLDPEQLELLRNIHETRISGHMGRGFTILDTGADGKTFCIRDKADYFDDAKRPLWFVYSGMGSQWAGMGAQLMRIPLFAAAIEKCRRVLEPKGVDIVHIITSPDKTIFDNILHSFVGIAAVQIGLTDILKALGIVPDKIIGHSVGELGCAYADGCFTAEEMILSAYSRGLVSVQTPFIKGSMAAVGIGYQEVINLCPPEIEVACHNGPDSCTISGPADVMKKFVTELTAKHIFAKEVPCSNIAYHSRYIAEAGPGLLKYLREVIKDPKPRSDRWVSTSVPRERWSEPVAKYSSADYHTNNLLNPVLFEETSVLIPANAVCVEIAPHGLLQAILKRSLPGTCQHIPLTKRGHPDNVLMVLEGIGKLYLEGFNPKVKALYPKVELPVSTGTPMLSHLVEWAHNEPWDMALFVSARRKTAAACKYVISLFDDEHKYLQGHIVRGNTMYPFAASLMNAWNTLSMSVGAGQLGAGADGGVTFRNLRLHAAPTLHENDALSLKVQLHRGSGNFEIVGEHSNVATGFISLEVDALKPEFSKEFSSNEKMTLNSEDVYRILNERDYAYKGSFRSIISSNASFTEAEIAWEDNWVTFLEGILQLFALREKHDGVSRPFIIRRLTIDLKEHALRVREVGGRMVATAQVFEEHGFTRCGGVVIENVKLKNLPPLVEDMVSLQTLKFFPRFQSDDIDILTALQVHLQILSENISKDVINAVGILTLGCDDTVFNCIGTIVNDVPGITINYEQIKKEKILDEKADFLTDADLVVVQNLSIDENLCQTLYRFLQRDTFVLNLEQKEIDFNRPRPSGLYRVVASYNAGNSKIELTKWRPTVPNAATTAVSVRDPADIELLKNTRNDIPNRQKLIIFASYPVPPGLKELVRKWRGQAKKNHIYVFVVNENESENLFDKLPELDLAFNTLSQGIWGGMYYVPCSSQPQAGTLVCLQSKGVNDLQSIHWAQVASPKTDGLTVQVHFAGLNDTDAKRAAGVYSFPPNSELGDTYYGMDYSGVTDKGVRVMGVVAGGAARSRVAAGRLTWPLPAHWSLQDAATVPLPYAHAAYCLGVKMRMWRGMRMLIHGGAGALGQAAISIALAHDCEVFTTVSDVRKKRFLTKLFPELKEDHIGNSRDHTFGDMVLSLTKGKGVDVVISNTKGDLKNISMSCCGGAGIMFDTVQLQSQEEYEFGMYYLTLERNYVNVDFSSILLQDNVEDLLVIQTIVAEGISRGYVRPLSRVVFPAAAAGRALALLQGSRHRGRVLLDLTTHTDHLPRLVCSPSTSYALVIDDESFGLQVAERLITRGAMKLLIHVQKTSNFMEYKIRSLQQLGVEVQITSQNLLDANNAVSFVRTAQKQAPLEGLYVVCNNHDDVTDRKFVIMLTNLDAAARKLCPDVKNFAVVSEQSDIGAQVCLQRIAANLPATALQLPKLKQVQDSPPSGRQVSWRGGVECVERAVSAAPAVLRGRGAARPRTLLQQLADRAEITIPSDAKESLTLQELGGEASKVAGIAAFLRDVHNVAISEGDIPSLTIAKIKEIHLSVYGSTLAEVRGLGTFFGYVDPDEMLATTEIVFLPTLVNTATMRDDEFDVSQTYLSVVPGLEGHYKRFESISARLQLPALVLQPGLDRATDDHIKRAHAYAQILLKKTELKNNFYLLGYESGVIVALEMAAILEEHGLFGTVFCIGVTPEELKNIVLEEIGDFDETNLRERVMRHMFTLMGGQNTAELEQALSKTSSWEERLDTCVRTLLGHVAHSIQYTKSQIEAAVTSIQQMVNFQSKPKKLKSKIIFLRAKGAKSKDLQAFSEQPVTVYDLDLPLAHCARDMRCSAIINNHLDEKSVELFKNKNLCETYLLANADIFMTTSGE